MTISHMQLTTTRGGTITPQLKRVAAREELRPEVISDEVARGRMIIPAMVAEQERASRSS